MGADGRTGASTGIAFVPLFLSAPIGIIRDFISDFSKRRRILKHREHLGGEALDLVAQGG